MSDAYENDFNPMYAIIYPISVKMNEYEPLKVDNKLVVFDNREVGLEYIRESGNTFMQRYCLLMKVSDTYPEDQVIHYSWITDDLKNFHMAEKEWEKEV